MNKIFKVIWSKSRNCYVVASELAKGTSKSTSTGRMAKRAALAAVAALLLFPAGIGNSYAENTATVTDTSGNQQTVYTKEGTDAQIDAANKYTYRKAAELDKKLTDQKTSTALHISSTGDLIVGTKENQTVKDMEIRGELTSGSLSTGDITSTGDVSVAGKVEAEAVYDDTTKTGNYVVQTNSVGANLSALDTQVKSNADAIEEEARKRKYSVTNLENADKQLQTNIDNEAAAREAADTALDTRITNVKEYLQQEAADTYVSKDDAAVQDGAIVKAANTIGDNVTKLDAALAKETADRLGADAAQDKVIQQVNDNLVASVNTINQNMATINQNVADGFTALSQADATEVAAREEADEKLQAAIDEEARKRKYSVTNLENADKQLQTNIDNEAAAREAADTEIKQAMTDQKTSTALHVSKDGNLIVGTKENQVVKNMKINGQLTSGSLSTGDITSTGDVSVAGKVEAEAVYDDTTKTGNYVVQTNSVGANLSALDTQVKSNADAIEEEARKRKYSVTNLENADKQLQTNIDNEAAAREAADTALDSRTTALEDKTEAITYDKDSKTVMVDGKLTATEGITDGTTQDGQYVKADNYVGQNLNALDQGLQAETSARVAADTKLVEAVNSGLSLSDDNVLQKNTTAIDAQGNVTTSKTDANEMILNKGNDNQITLNENGIKVGTNSSVMDKDGVYTGGDTYSEAKAAMSADGKIKGANGDFTVDENGNVTSKATITGETVTDGKGASMSNGTVTGKTLTDGIATITNGNINTSGSITGGTVTSTGNISAVGDIHAGGAITGASASIQGALTAGSATITGDLTAGGAIQGKSISDGTATMQNGNLTGVKNLSAETITTSGNATIGGDLTVNGKLNVDEIDLTKNGIVGDNNVTASTKVAAGEITSYQKATSTKDGSEKESAIDYDESGTSTWAKSTDADGNWNKSTLTVEGSKVTSKVIDSEKNSNLSTQTSTQSQSTLTDKDGKTSTFNQRVDEILNQINSSDMVFSKVDQKVDNITSEVTDGTNTTSSTQTTTDITNTATNGTISNNAKELTNTASDSITNKAENGNISNIASNGTISNEAKTISNKAAEAMTNDAKTITNTASESVTTQIGDGSAVQSVMNESGIANKATGKSITNDAATITNTGTTSVTNQVDNNKVLVDTTHVQSAFGDTIYTTWDESGITNNATDKTVATNARDILNTATGNITNSATNGTITNTAKDLVNTATGNMTNTVGGELKTTVTGKVTEDYKSDLDTKVGGNETHYVAGNQTNIVGGDQQNTVSGSKTETVKGSVTEKYGSQATTIDGDQSTHVGGNQSNVVAGDQTNTISGSKTESVKGSVTETYGSQSTTVNGDQSTTVKGNQSNTVEGTLTETVTGKATENYNGGLETTITGEEKHTVKGSQTNNITGDQTNTIGGNQTTTVTGDSSLSAKNISNTAATSITNKVGDNVSTTMSTDSIVNKVGKTTITTTDGKTKLTNEDSTHETEMDYATVLKDLGVRGSATVDQNLTVKGDSDLQGNANVGKNLTVNGTSDLKGDVTMESNATVKKDLVIEGKTTTNELVVNKGATVTGGTTTDTLHVTSTSTFDGAATFKDAVTMEKDLSVGGSMTASSYKVGDKTYIDSNGINANNQKIVNVAAGDLSASSTDAVNGSQLYQTNERVASVENRVDTVENRVSNLDSRVDKVGANAAALANLHPLEFDADSKWNIAAAVGGYKGETATAIGAFYRPNENVMVNVSSSFGTGENMYGGGISLRIGQGGNKARRNATNGLTEREKAQQKQIDYLTSRLDALLSVINPNMSKAFPDVPENHWAYEAVSRLAGNGIIQGYEDGKYHGERTMTRYEMAEIIYNALSKGAKAEKKLVEEFKPELQAMAAQKKA